MLVTLDLAKAISIGFVAAEHSDCSKTWSEA